MVINIKSKGISEGAGTGSAAPAISEELLEMVESAAQEIEHEETLFFSDLCMQVHPTGSPVIISMFDPSHATESDVENILSKPLFLPAKTKVVCYPQEGIDVLKVLNLGSETIIQRGTHEGNYGYSEIPIVEENGRKIAKILEDGYYSFYKISESIQSPDDPWSSVDIVTLMNAAQLLRSMVGYMHTPLKVVGETINLGYYGRNHQPIWEDDTTGEMRVGLFVVGQTGDGLPLIIIGAYGEVLLSESGLVTPGGGHYGMYETVQVKFVNEDQDFHWAGYIALSQIFDIQRHIARKAGYDPEFPGGEAAT